MKVRKIMKRTVTRLRIRIAEVEGTIWEMRMKLRIGMAMKMRMGKEIKIAVRRGMGLRLVVRIGVTM